MTHQQLTSKDNPLLKTIRRIAAGSGRDSPRLVAAEGIRVLEEATGSGYEIEAVVISGDFGGTAREKALLDAWEANFVPVRTVTDALFKSVSALQTPQGAVALVRMPDRTLDDALPDNGASMPLMLIADQIQDPGNLGTLIRTAAAAGASMVVALSGTVSARNTKVVRASAGALFRIPVIETIDAARLIDFCRAHVISLYRTDAHDGTGYTNVDFSVPCAVLLGNEGGGISEKTFAGLPAITIPMAHNAESLNVAMAGTIIFFEAFRQRSHHDNPCRHENPCH